MSINWRGLAWGRALLSSAAIVALAPSALAEPISEADAVARALALPEYEALGAAERDAANARIRAIGRFDNPEASISREAVSGSAGRETEWHGEISQPIDVSGRRAGLRDAARFEAQAVGADVARRRQQRVAEVREAYAGCAAATEKVEIQRDFAARLREAERIVALRTRAGDTAGYDLRRLRVEARAADAQLQLANGEIKAECATLSRLTGVADARPTVALSALVPASHALGTASRQDVVAREARSASAEAEVRAAERSRIPDLTIGVGYKRLSGDEGSAGGPTVSLGARLPIFNNNGAAIAEARARQRVRQAELALSRREVEASIAAASARAGAANAAAATAREAAGDAARLGTIAEAAYQGGESGVVELVDAYRTARNAQLEIVELTERAVRATITQSLAEGRE